jgi:hypothetical protein
VTYLFAGGEFEFNFFLEVNGSISAGALLIFGPLNVIL